MWLILLSNADWDCFKTPILKEILRTQNPLLEEHCAFLEVIQFVPISCMCKKQTSVSHSSTEPENHFFGCRIEIGWYPRIVLWDLIVAILHGNTNQSSQARMTLISFPQTSNFSHQEALLYVFEDNEAVIKMIIKGRSPTMRHVSRTHRVALDWLFDRINLDPKSKSNTLTAKTNSQTR